MSGPQGTYLIPGFGYVPYSGFWGPVGDIYPLTPVWSEHHTPQGLAATSSAEADLWQNIIVPSGVDYTFSIDLTDLGTDLTSDADDLPAGDPATSYEFDHVVSTITAPFGWARNLQFSIEAPGVVGNDGSDWDGTLNVTVDQTLQAQIGFNQSCPFRITLFMKDRTTSAMFRVDVMIGDIVVRP